MILVFTTVPKGKGKEIAKQLLEKRLIACANIVESNSLYWWDNKIEESEEELLILKTRDELYDKLEYELKQIHPYEVPEIIAVEVKDGNAEYLRWIDKETKIRR